MAKKVIGFGLDTTATVIIFISKFRQICNCITFAMKKNWIDVFSIYRLFVCFLLFARTAHKAKTKKKIRTNGVHCVKYKFIHYMLFYRCLLADMFFSLFVLFILCWSFEKYFAYKTSQQCIIVVVAIQMQNQQAILWKQFAKWKSERTSLKNILLLYFEIPFQLSTFDVIW